MFKLLVFPASAVIFFLGAVLFFYRGTYDTPPSGEIPAHQIQAPVSTFNTMGEVPPIQHGTLLVDAGHNNDYIQEEVAGFLSKISQRGYGIDFLGEFMTFGGPVTLNESVKVDLLKEGLRGADSFLVLQPGEAYTKEEVREIRRFVLEKGGKLLLVGDPSRTNKINSLAQGFGITFRPDYLYNQTEYDLNFQDIFISDFRADEVTSGLGRISLSTSGSLQSSGTGLAISSANTQSTIVGNIEPLYVMVKSPDGSVVAIGDMTFMIPPQDAIFDNARLISNLANFLTKNQRQFHLEDFPHFFSDDVDIVLSRSGLVDAGGRMKSLLSLLQIGANISAVENLERDSVYLGLYDDAVQVTQYLQLEGVQVGSTVLTSFAPEIEAEGTAVVILHRSAGRQVLVVLGDTPESLDQALDQLSSGDFRDGLLGDFVGVYKTS